MAFKEIKDELGDIKTNSEEFITSSLNYYRLWGFKVSVKASSIFMTVILLSLFLMMAMLFLSLFAAFAIGESLDYKPFGFLIVGGVYIVFTIIVYLLRKQLVEKPLLKKLSEIILQD
ncbi:hypothetical protein [Myroides sp. LJL119]